ncbi:MAG: glycosyl hydrolase 108 family protein [Syntrophorhabdales bacterium]|jgi:hypothetical protein
MINFVSFFPFSNPDPDLADAPVMRTGQASPFLNLLKESVARITTPDARRIDPPAPPPLSPSFSFADTVPAISTTAGSTVKEALRFVLVHEGGAYVARDGGRESSKYGILQSTAARCGYHGDVKDMSQIQAEAIYKKLWKESGAQRLPPSLALVHFDTYINSPAAAKKILQSSGGDTDSYLQLRSQRYARLAQAKPEKYAKYLKGWMNRIQDLRVAVAYAKA